MKKLPLILLALTALAFVLPSCFKDNDDFDKYADWYAANVKWYDEQANLKQMDGDNYYTTVTATWDPAAEVLIHWFNDTSLTRGNLKPLYNSQIDVKYKGRLYNDEPFDSSYLSTSPGDSLYRCRLNNMIEGWAIAFTHMHIGDSCRIIIPYNVGYGSTGSGSIKPYSTLQFDVKLVGIPKLEK